MKPFLDLIYKFHSLFSGFNSSRSFQVLVLAAASRSNLIDETFKRRFDRHIIFALPDLKGRSSEGSESSRGETSELFSGRQPRHG